VFATTQKQVIVTAIDGRPGIGETKVLGQETARARTVVHLIVGPARDERCVVLSLSCGGRLRPGYPQHYCTLGDL